MSTFIYHVDEAGDGVLFGPKGRDRLADTGANQFFMLGMVCIANPEAVQAELTSLRTALQRNPLYAGIPSMQPVEGKTARAFHAKDDHPEIRAKVFELITSLDFKFFAVIKDMRKVREYVRGRNEMSDEYRYHPNELYDLTVRILLKTRLHRGGRLSRGLRKTGPIRPNRSPQDSAGKGANTLPAANPTQFHH